MGIDDMTTSRNTWIYCRENYTVVHIYPNPERDCVYVLKRTSWVRVLQLADGFNGADLRNVGTEAGLFAIRADRDYVLEVCV